MYIHEALEVGLKHVILVKSLKVEEAKYGPEVAILRCLGLLIVIHCLKCQK